MTEYGAGSVRDCEVLRRMRRGTTAAGHEIVLPQPMKSSDLSHQRNLVGCRLGHGVRIQLGDTPVVLLCVATCSSYRNVIGSD